MAISVGKYQCYVLKNGTFYVDGGTLFGVVPKALWVQKVHADALNRVKLSMNPLLIVGPDQKILVDPGIGLREAKRFREHYAIEGAGKLNQELGILGVTPEEIDIVINSHLHWDHSGANQITGSDGHPAPAFPNAKYFVQKGEWEEACNPNEWTRASYLFQDDPALLRSGQLVLLQGDQEISPGIRVIQTPGHTPYHQSVLVEDQGKALIYAGDLIPTRYHLPLPYITSLDLEPVRSLETKKKVLHEAQEKGWMMVLCHEIEEKILDFSRPFSES